MTVVGKFRQSDRLDRENFHIEDEVTSGQWMGEINNYLGIRNADNQARHLLAGWHDKTKHLSCFECQLRREIAARHDLYRLGAGRELTLNGADLKTTLFARVQTKELAFQHIDQRPASDLKSDWFSFTGTVHDCLIRKGERVMQRDAAARLNCINHTI